MRKRIGVIALAAVSALGFGGTYAMAADHGIPAIKFIVVTKPLTPTAKAVFVAKDLSITKGAGTDATDISVTLDASYDNGADPDVQGQWVAAEGSANWIVNKDTVAKYVNKLAPSGGATKVVVVKPGNLIKLVGKSTGDTPMDILSTSSAPGGTASTKYTIDNGGTVETYCSTFSGCVWKSIAAGTGAKLVCKGGVSNPTCAGFCDPPPVATDCGPGGGSCVSFVTGAAGGTCGHVKSGGTGGTTRKSLTCGGLNVGGGNSTVAEGPTPGGAQTIMNISAGPPYTVSGRSAAATGSSNNCSATGCVFGPYLPIANSGTSTCVRNTFSAGATGTLTAAGVFDGSFPLTSTVYLTANGSAPCPRCEGGCPGIVGSGTCQAGWTSGVGPSLDEGDPCTPTDAAGDTYDCAPPAGAVLPSFPVDLTPITTGTASFFNAGGLFCPSQANSGAFGCSGGASGGTPSICPSGTTAPLIDYVDEVGSATPLAAGQTPTTLASVFCIPSVSGGLGFLINGAANLPGPGATSLPGTLDILP